MSVGFLSEGIQFLKGIGPHRSKVLADHGVGCVRDLLQYFPRRYLDRSTVVSVRDLTENGEAVTVVGTVRSTATVPSRRRRRFEMVVEDSFGGRVKCVWFQQVGWVSKVFEVGDRVAIHGKPQVYGRLFSFSHPDFDKLDEDSPSLDTGRIISLYRGAAGLQRVGITSRSLRRVIYNLFKEQGDRIPEVLPEWVLREHHLIEGRVALRAAHFPKSRDEVNTAIHRLKFEELFFVQLMLCLMRQSRQDVPGPVFERGGRLTTRFLNEALTFQLTRGQENALTDVATDCASGRQMNRLIQGDVGCGKTIVGIAALLQAIDNGFQGAFMAPTEILAEQHYASLIRYLHPLGVRVDILLGKQSRKDRERALARISTGQTDLVVGTHALIQETVEFDRLGMAVIDEQHRFGVMQRASMFSKGENPHMLLMTATPIPRSLAMTLYGDLDVTVIRDMPPGRTPVETRLYFDNRREEMYRFLGDEVQAGRQAYVVYPLVEESEKVDLKDAQSGFDKISRLSPDVRVDLVHGRMKGDDKEAAMQRFKTGKTRLLVATTVIEVGVDIPNATVMVIEHAERFGLSQLHQLRGRVGRGPQKSYCLLMADYKRSAESRERLEALVRTTDGFEISEVDLRIRGAGDFFGTRQSGLPELRIADLTTDTLILSQAREAAARLLREDPQIIQAEHRTVRDYFDRFYAQEGLQLARVG